MNENSVLARHYLSGQPVRLSWDSGGIRDIRATDDPASDLWLAPPLVDLQVNGYAGVDFQRDDVPLDALVHAARGLAQDGCACWMLTLISDDWTRLTARLRHFRQLRAQSAFLGHVIAGWHIEGPFLSAEPGFCGAHDPAVMIDPTPQKIRELRDLTGNDPLMITLAPERAGALPAIELAASLGMVVSLGHTNASSAVLAEAAQAGARAFTHLGNGCPRSLDRHDNILWRVLENGQLTISLIPDAIHVSAPLFRLVHRLIPFERIFYVTDAMSAAGSPPGRYPLGRLNLEVGSDQIVRLPGQPNFAGSALRPIDGVRRAAQMLGQPWPKAWSAASTIPMRFMGLAPALVSGALADFCLIESPDGATIENVRTFIGGEECALGTA